MVWSRRGADFTDRFARIADAVRGLNADEALIDGEAVVFSDGGRTDFHALLTKGSGAQAMLMALARLTPRHAALRRYAA
jgi:ATP-dependent DNA ligase